MVLQPVTWWSGIIRGLFCFLDMIIYTLIKWVLYGAFDLANLTTSSDFLNGLYTRVYVIVGIFMAFKLSFSFFQYLVDPESMGGKSEKGVSKLITNMVIVLVGLVAIPTILFNSNGGGLIVRAQNAFLPMVPRLILGINNGDSGVSNSSDNISDIANMMATYTMRAFFSPSEEVKEVCNLDADPPAIESLSDFQDNVNLECNGHLFGKKYYVYSYTIPCSSIVGVLMVFMLLGITIDIAKRLFKMIILEAMAPIPIMSLIDPKSKKDGAFSHWLKNLISTFADIFVKLGLLYLVLMILQQIFSKGLFNDFPAFTEQPLRASYLTILLILGLIFFAKEAPKFIKDSLGMKDSGGGLGAGMGAAVGAVGGLIGGQGLSGMLTGAMAGATADPKVGSFAAGRDTAGAIRTGDKNYKGGMVNTLAKTASSRQAVKTARSIGVTGGKKGTLEAAKKAMLEAKSAASSAQMDYNEALQRGASSEELAKKRTSYIELQSAADSAKRKYESMNKVAEAYGLNDSKQAEYLKNNRIVHRATRKAGELGKSAVGTASKIPGIGGVISSATDAVELGSKSLENRENKRVLRTVERNDDSAPRVMTYPGQKKDYEDRINQNDKAREQLRNDIKNRFGGNNNNNNNNNNSGGNTP